MTPLPPAWHLLRAKDLIDARYREPLDVPTLARAVHLSPAHFSSEFRRAFAETPHQYFSRAVKNPPHRFTWTSSYGEDDRSRRGSSVPSR
jgi:hypothetical protein